MKLQVRTRFAPSPTGSLHLGSLRTALYNYLYAKQNSGQFFLRIEDTDKERTVPNAIEDISNILEWAGLRADNADKVTVQSERLELYHHHAQRLLSEGKLYRCFCPKERLEALRESNKRYQYDRHCRYISVAESEERSKEPHVLRFKMPTEYKSHILLQDTVYGEIKILAKTVEDAIMLKSDGYPTYHFANVVDDHDMKITMVLRGQEWLPSTPLHLLLYGAFDWEPPQFAHLPLLVNENGSKLSKRQGDAIVSGYRNAGYLPSAMLNFIALLGWSPNQHRFGEVLDLVELAEAFDIGKINKADAVVNLDKLKWFNRQHLVRQSKDADKVTKMSKQLATILKADHTLERSQDLTYLSSIIQLMADRIHFVEDIPRLCIYFFKDPVYESARSRELLAEIEGKVGREALVLSLKEWQTELLKSQAEFSINNLSDLMKRLKRPFDSSTYMISLRWSVTGEKVGATVLGTMHLLGKNVVCRRLGKAIDHLTK